MRILFSLFFLIVASISPAHANETNEPDGYTEAIVVSLPSFYDNESKLLNSKFEVGYMFTSMRYQEQKMYDLAKLNGITAAYNWYNDDKSLRIRGEADYSQGNYKYFGQYWGGKPLTMEGTTDIANVRGLVGSAYPVSATVLATPYGGLGYRFTKTDEDHSAGYKRHITYLYLPVGADLSMLPFKNQNIRVRANLEGQFLISGKAKAFMEEDDSRYNNPEVRQSRGYGFRASVAGDFKIGKTVASIQPYFQFWRVENSNLAKLMKDPADPYYVREPYNETSAAGAVASVLF